MQQFFIAKHMQQSFHYLPTSRVTLLGCFLPASFGCHIVFSKSRGGPSRTGPIPRIQIVLSQFQNSTMKSDHKRPMSRMAHDLLSFGAGHPFAAVTQD